jgi:hypothetical protein
VRYGALPLAQHAAGRTDRVAFNQGGKNLGTFFDAQIRRGADSSGKTELICMVFDTFIDDSGDPMGREISAAGGFVTLDSIWDQFDLLWLSRTRDLKEPFHATDCECGHGQFAKWSKQDRDCLNKNRRSPGFAGVAVAV